MSVLFRHCVEGLHQSCIRFGPPPNTVGGNRVECCCPCHTTPDPWKPSDADRMALYMASEHGVDPRTEQIVEGEPGGMSETCPHGIPIFGPPCPDCEGRAWHESQNLPAEPKPNSGKGRTLSEEEP